MVIRGRWSWAATDWARETAPWSGAMTTVVVGEISSLVIELLVGEKLTVLSIKVGRRDKLWMGTEKNLVLFGIGQIRNDGDNF